LIRAACPVRALATPSCQISTEELAAQRAAAGSTSAMRPPAGRKPNCPLLPVRRGLPLESRPGSPGIKAIAPALRPPRQDSRRMPGYDKKRADCRMSRCPAATLAPNQAKIPSPRALSPPRRPSQALPAQVEEHPNHERNRQNYGNKAGQCHHNAAHRFGPAALSGLPAPCPSCRGRKAPQNQKTPAAVRAG